MISQLIMSDRNPPRFLVGIIFAAVLCAAFPACAESADAENCSNGDGVRAIAACSEIIAAGQDTDVSWALFDRARAYFNAHMYGSAVSDLSDLLHTKPNDVEALENRGLAFLALDDYQHAIGDFDSLIALQPASVNGLRERCWARAASNRDLDDASEDCDHALSLKPGDALALDARCFVEMRKSAYARAVADCTVALTADQSLASSYYLRGVAKRKSGDTVRGDADIDSARARDPDIAQTFALYGIKP